MLTLKELLENKMLVLALYTSIFLIIIHGYLFVLHNIKGISKGAHSFPVE